MILKKPYAFFIRMFKPMHVVIAFLIVYLTYLTSKILGFLNTYMSTKELLAENIKSNYLPSNIFLIPALIILLSLIMIGIMFRKKKPYLFYLINIVLYIVVLIISWYTSNFFGIIEKAAVSIRVLKLMHDLILINLIIEVVTFMFFLVRGIGLDFKKFEFESDLFNIDISESDKEEIELDINVDLNESRRKRRHRIRLLKYKYLENKFMYNSIAILIVIFIFVTSFIVFKSLSSKNIEGNIYSVGLINLAVENSIVIDKDYKGNKITNNSLIVVSCKINSKFGTNNVGLNDFSLVVDELNYRPTTKYNDYLVDFGTVYSGEKLDEEYSNYIFVYEIPKDSLNKNMLFKYTSGIDSIDIIINPAEEVNNKIANLKKLTEEMSFDETLGDISFRINSYAINDKFIINYRYCIKTDDCISSKEYLKPSINQNFDKTILKINVDFKNNSKFNINSFYDLFSIYGSIYYSIDNEWKVQEASFEQIKSTKVNVENDIYIGINDKVLEADSIKLVFDIRNYKYEYIIK